MDAGTFDIYTTWALGMKMTTASVVSSQQSQDHQQENYLFSFYHYPFREGPFKEHFDLIYTGPFGRCSVQPQPGQQATE